MAIHANFHAIKSARTAAHKTDSHAFDCVMIYDDGDGEVALFLPHRTGQAVADAINAAIAGEVTK